MSGHLRAAVGGRPTSRGGGALSGAKLIGVSVHYPASGNVTIGTNRAGAVRRLQGYRDFRVNGRGRPQALQHAKA